MTIEELKEWLTDVPDNARLVVVYSDNMNGLKADSPVLEYTCTPIYCPETKTVTMIAGE